jgi:hypothetical protein
MGFHKAKDSPKDEYCTPKWIIDLAKKTLRWIDTDPWTNQYALDHNLVHGKSGVAWGTKSSPLPMSHWGIRCWGNPPYSKGAINEAVLNWLTAFNGSVAREGLIITNCTPTSPWWKDLARECSWWCALNERVSFIDPRIGKEKTGNMWPSSVFYFKIIGGQIQNGVEKCQTFIETWAPFGCIFPSMLSLDAVVPS